MMDLTALRTLIAQKESGAEGYGARGQHTSRVRAPARGKYQLTATTAEGLVRKYPGLFPEFNGPVPGETVLNMMEHDPQLQERLQDVLMQDQQQTIENFGGSADDPVAIALLHRFGAKAAKEYVHGRLPMDRPIDGETPAHYAQGIPQRGTPLAMSSLPPLPPSPSSAMSGTPPQGMGAPQPEPESYEQSPMSDVMRHIAKTQGVPIGGRQESSLDDVMSHIGRSQAPGDWNDAKSRPPEMAMASAGPADVQDFRQSPMPPIDLPPLPQPPPQESPLRAALRGGAVAALPWMGSPDEVSQNVLRSQVGNLGVPSGGWENSHWPQPVENGGWMDATGRPPRGAQPSMDEILAAIQRTQSQPSRLPPRPDITFVEAPTEFPEQQFAGRAAPPNFGDVGGYRSSSDFEPTTPAAPWDSSYNPHAPQEAGQSLVDATRGLFNPLPGAAPQTMTEPAPAEHPAAAALRYHMASSDPQGIFDHEQHQQARAELARLLAQEPQTQRRDPIGDLASAFAGGAAIGGYKPGAVAYGMIHDRQDKEDARLRYQNAMQQTRLQNLEGMLGRDDASRHQAWSEREPDTITLPDGQTVPAGMADDMIRAQRTLAMPPPLPPVSDLQKHQWDVEAADAQGKQRLKEIEASTSWHRAPDADAKQMQQDMNDALQMRQQWISSNPVSYDKHSEPPPIDYFLGEIRRNRTAQTPAGQIAASLAGLGQRFDALANEGKSNGTGATGPSMTTGPSGPTGAAGLPSLKPIKPIGYGGTPGQ